MALWSVTVLGSTPIGGAVMGAVSQHLGPRAGLALGAGACLLATGLGLLALPRIPVRHRFIEHRTARRHPPTLTEADRT